MRLVSETPLPLIQDLRSGFEDSTERLREAIAVFEAIETGALLEDLPPGPARARHQCAVSLLNVLRRELNAVAERQLDLLDPPQGSARR